MVKPITYKNVGMQRPVNNTADLIQLQSRGYNKAIQAVKDGLQSFADYQTGSALLNMQNAANAEERKAISLNAGILANRAKLAKALHTHELDDRAESTHNLNIQTGELNKDIAAAREARAVEMNPLKQTMLNAQIRGQSLNNQSNSLTLKERLKLAREKEQISRLSDYHLMHGTGINTSAVLPEGLTDASQLTSLQAAQIFRNEQKRIMDYHHAQGNPISYNVAGKITENILNSDPRYKAAVNRGNAQQSINTEIAEAKLKRNMQALDGMFHMGSLAEKGNIEELLSAITPNSKKLDANDIRQAKRGWNKVFRNLRTTKGYEKLTTPEERTTLIGSVFEAYRDSIYLDDTFPWLWEDVALADGTNADNIGKKEISSIVSTGMAKAAVFSPKLLSTKQTGKKDILETVRSNSKEGYDPTARESLNNIPSEFINKKDSKIESKILTARTSQENKKKEAKNLKEIVRNKKIADRQARFPNINIEKVLQRFKDDRNRIHSVTGGIIGTDDSKNRNLSILIQQFKKSGGKSGPFGHLYY